MVFELGWVGVFGRVYGVGVLVDGVWGLWYESFWVFSGWDFYINTEELPWKRIIHVEQDISLDGVLFIIFNNTLKWLIALQGPLHIV